MSSVECGVRSKRGGEHLYMTDDYIALLQQVLGFDSKAKPALKC